MQNLPDSSEHRKKTKHQMDVEKKEYLVTGTPNKKANEKIRLKLRLLINGHKKCILGITPIKDVPRLAYEFELVVYKYLFYLYKSTSEQKIKMFYNHFYSMYANELTTEEFEEIKCPEKAVTNDGPLLLYLLGKSKKRVF
jgi:hypothetical protein